MDLLRSVRESITRELEATGFERERAEKVAARVCKNLSAEFGGEVGHIPKVDRAQRDAQILEDWRNGLDAKQITHKHGISQATFYRILNRRGEVVRDDEFCRSDWAL